MFHTTLWSGDWNYWDWGHKITVDTVNKRINVNEGVTDLNIKIDVYRAIKEYFKDREGGFSFPIRTTGGDATIGTDSSGDIYFMTNGYYLYYDPTKVKIVGVLFNDDDDTAYRYSVNGDKIFPAIISNLVLGVRPNPGDFDIPTLTQIRSELQSEFDAIPTVTEIHEELQSEFDAIPTLDNIWNYIIESDGNLSSKQIMQLTASALAGEVVITDNGLTITFKTPNGGSVRIVSKVDVVGNRTSEVLTFG